MKNRRFTYKDFIDHKNKRKRNFNIIFSIISSIVFIIYSFLHIYYFERNLLMVFALFIMSFVFALNAFYLKLNGDVELSSNVLLLLAIVLIFLTIIYGAKTDFRLVWFCMIPLLAFYLKSHIKGFFFVIVAFFVILIAFLLNSQFGLVKNQIKTSSFIDTFVIFTAITLAGFYYEHINVENEKYILRQLFTDSLTNIPNRTSLINDITNKVGNKLILINVDNFKHVNDLYGNVAGDLILIEICKRISVFKTNQYVVDIYKLHADEFAILFTSDIDRKELYDIAVDIERTLSQVYFVENLELLLNITMGISDTGEKPLEESDMALKLAKENKEAFLFFDPSMKIKEKYENNIFWIKTIKKAITNDSIVPFYQPIYNNKTEKIEKFECLIRILNGEEIITPDKFLEIAKKSKYYTHLTKIIMLKAVSTFVDRDFDFCINLSLYDIYSKESTQFFISVIDDFKIGNKIVFEFTESEQIENNKQVAYFVEKVKERGCKIAIDDFGTGYSNFEYLLKMNVDILKIDGTLIKDIVLNKHSKVVVDAIVSFAKKLKISTVAEYVSSKEVFEVIKKMGINYSQGYIIGKPCRDIDEFFNSNGFLSSIN